MKKAEALNAIRYEVATYGEVTNKAMRLYVENRISKNLMLLLSKVLDITKQKIKCVN